MGPDVSRCLPQEAQDVFDGGCVGQASEAHAVSPGAGYHREGDGQQWSSQCGKECTGSVAVQDLIRKAATGHAREGRDTEWSGVQGAPCRSTWGWGSPACSPVAPRLQCSGRVQCIAYPACPCACAVQLVPAPHRQRVQRHRQWAGRQGGAQRAAPRRPQSPGILAPGSRARLSAQPRRAVPAAAGSPGLPATGTEPPLVMCLDEGGMGVTY